MDKEKLSTQSLVFGILSLVFTECSILGIIFGAVGKSKAKIYEKSNKMEVTSSPARRRSARSSRRWVSYSASSASS